MKLSWFKSVRKTEEVLHTLEVLSALAQSVAATGQQADAEELLNVYADNDRVYHYLGSSSAGDVVLYHYFVEKGDNDLYAMCRLAPGEDIQVVSEYSYLTFRMIVRKVFVAKRQDGLFDLLVDGEKVCSDLVNTDVLTLGSVMSFIQLDFQDGRSLLCTDENGAMFFPQNEEHFIAFFQAAVRRFGYEGKLDDVPLSVLMQIYHEVCNCIFESATFKVLQFPDTGKAGRKGQLEE